MAKGSFERSLAAVLKHEGGWADHPSDPGGATMKGVTFATFLRYYPGSSKSDLRNITDAQLRRIYKAGYWDVIRGDDLPSGLDYAVFDFAVNSGPARAAIFMQELVGTAPDGKIGPLTLKAVESHSAKTLIADLCAKRLAFLQRLSTWPVFGKGWKSRVDGVRTLALQMAAEPSKPVPAPTQPEPPEPPPTGSAGGFPWPIIIILGVAAAAFFIITQVRF